MNSDAADCEQHRPNWYIDTQAGFVRIRQSGKKVDYAVQLKEMERITDQMISLA